MVVLRPQLAQSWRNLMRFASVAGDGCKGAVDLGCSSPQLCCCLSLAHLRREPHWSASHSLIWEVDNLPLYHTPYMVFTHLEVWGFQFYSQGPCKQRSSFHCAVPLTKTGSPSFGFAEIVQGAWSPRTVAQWWNRVPVWHAEVSGFSLWHLQVGLLKALFF